MNRLSSNQTTAKPTGSFFRSNPVMNRLNKMDIASAAPDEKAAGYGRITVKTAYFLLMTVVGMLAYLALNQFIFSGQAQALNFEYKGFTFTTSMMTVIYAAVAGILAIITQLIAAFVPASIPVTGTIYSMCQGFIISFLIFTVIKGYEYLGLLALAITIVVVFTMSILYTTGVIRVTKKFKMVLMTLIFGMLGISLFSLIGYLIPLTRPFVGSILGNFWVSIGLTVLSLIIACLFLISDFAVIDHVVENRLPAKYEWMASFGLAFTILWIYVKILDLLIQIVGKNKK